MRLSSGTIASLVGNLTLRVRFTQTGYDFLTVIECKKEKSKVPVKEVEAFVTKSRSVRANKAVMVSKYGYQSGSIEVGQREDVTLLSLIEKQDTSNNQDHQLNVLTLVENTRTGDRIRLGLSHPPLADLIDPDVQKNITKKYALVDLSGKAVAEAFLTDLRLGQWRDVEIGKFYRQPVVNAYYYCHSIDDGMITWILVESWQHGKLFQLIMEQGREHASQFHVVTDKGVISRLQDRLGDYVNRVPARRALLT